MTQAQMKVFQFNKSVNNLEKQCAFQKMVERERERESDKTKKTNDQI